MEVVCTKNRLAAVAESGLRERLSRSIHLDGPIDGLEVGRVYPVQAIGELDGGLWFYLHTIQERDYPSPYPAEMFEWKDDRVPAGWSLQLSKRGGNVACQRLTFSAWANDDSFYERLVDGDAEAVAIYRRCMI